MPDVSGSVSTNKNASRFGVYHHLQGAGGKGRRGVGWQIPAATSFPSSRDPCVSLLRFSIAAPPPSRPPTPMPALPVPFVACETAAAHCPGPGLGLSHRPNRRTRYDVIPAAAGGTARPRMPRRVS